MTHIESKILFIFFMHFSTKVLIKKIDNVVYASAALKLHVYVPVSEVLHWHSEKAASADSNSRHSTHTAPRDSVLAILNTTGTIYHKIATL